VALPNTSRWSGREEKRSMWSSQSNNWRLAERHDRTDHACRYTSRSIKELTALMDRYSCMSAE
jgi:hypothetical protein